MQNWKFELRRKDTNRLGADQEEDQDQQFEQHYQKSRTPNPQINRTMLLML